MKSKIRVMLVEDSPDYCEIVGMALTHETDIKLTGQFSTAEIALRSLQAQPPAEHPALILLDLRLPGMDGLEGLPRFLAIAPGAKIVVLTQSKKEADVLRAISRGAAGYLLKSSTVSQINEGIHTMLYWMQYNQQYPVHTAELLHVKKAEKIGGISSGDLLREQDGSLTGRKNEGR